ncbi:hypothetical protein BD311DRAFT_378974 [Dichomitus squalens]|uniref:Uncharacterized protein n=1 Tax=Dichomitus squalens TaxID=114155 RepID=A0A4Q9MMZ0_9APHY|nr:hypothetical protein BD311DRAFT_378974 [Dichomitus squalens]
MARICVGLLLAGAKFCFWMCLWTSACYLSRVLLSHPHGSRDRSIPPSCASCSALVCRSIRHGLLTYTPALTIAVRNTLHPPSAIPTILACVRSRLVTICLLQ